MKRIKAAWGTDLIIYILLIVFLTCAPILPQTSVFAAPEEGLTEAEQKVRQDFPELRVFLKGDRYPYAYYEDGVYKGIYPDYLNRISELSGIKFTYVPYESDEQLEQLFTLAKADALGCTYGEWQGLYSVTDPYTTVEYNLIASPKSQITEEGSYTVAVSNTDTMIRHYIEENYPQWTIVPCSSLRDTLKKVNKGKADMTFMTALDLQLNYSLFSYGNIEVLDNFSLFVPVSIAVSDITCKDEMVTLLNKFIICEPLRSNDTIRRKYVLNSIYSPTITEYFLIHKELILLLLLLFVLAAAAIIWRWIRMRKKLETDSLTGLWNKRKFIKETEKTLKANRSTEYLIADLDVERFKVVNDRFGIQVGNQTLRTIANNISVIFKGGGIFGRSAGDEFVILTSDTPEHRKLLEDAANMDIKINNATYYKIPIKAGVCPLSYSGLSDLDVSNFIDRAKIANSKIKGHPDIKINYFTEKMGERIKRENELETIMRKSLKNNEFVVYYQPKYSLNDNSLIGAEALVRWQHPTKGLISPGDFIPLFEKNGFIVDVDFYVYERVIEMLSNRMEEKLPVVPVSMNVSRCHLNSPNFTKRLEELVARYGVPKNIIEMEITESVFSDEDRAAVTLMDDLKNHGFTISMDDFGSGYSSLNLLRELPIDILKIDKGFIDKTDDSDKSKVIVEEIISMATKINIRTVCEGVETVEQRDFLKQAGCNIAQGFFYARPMPQADFEKLLNEKK